jgi:hypothetical protein
MAATNPSRELEETFWRALHVCTSAQAAVASQRAQRIAATSLELGSIDENNASSRGDCRPHLAEKWEARKRNIRV